MTTKVMEVEVLGGMMPVIYTTFIDESQYQWHTVALPMLKSCYSEHSVDDLELELEYHIGRKASNSIMEQITLVEA